MDQKGYDYVGSFQGRDSSPGVLCRKFLLLFRMRYPSGLKWIFIKKVLSKPPFFWGKSGNRYVVPMNLRKLYITHTSVFSVRSILIKLPSLF